MSIGLPILATKITEIEEAVTHEENSILVDIDENEKMASAIIQLYENKNLRDTIGQKNRIRAVKQFNLEYHTNSIEKIYERLLPKHP